MADEQRNEMETQDHETDDFADQYYEYLLNESENRNLNELQSFEDFIFPGLLETAEVELEDPPPTELQQPSSSGSTSVSSSLQARHNWPGQYNFNVFFGQQLKNTKGVLWTYSDVKDKLYVSKDTPCPINFSTSQPMLEGVTLRAMIQYSSPEHAAKPVHRCYNHSMDELNAGSPKAQHLVRCDSKFAKYKENPNNQHLSVVIPWENPQDGEPHCTYLYHFACFQSCSGGPNRRPLTLVFLLEEYNGQVIGRRMLDLKICACPGRDRKTEEKNFESVQSAPAAAPKRREITMTDMSNAFTSFTRGVQLPVSKKRKDVPDADGIYTITTRERQCYELLCQCKVLYESCQTFRQNNLHETIIKNEEESE